MTWWQAVLLGLVQGLTEFLPVSSSGHLVIAQKLMGFEVHDLAFDVVAHAGTLLAVVTVFWRGLLSLVKDVFRDPFAGKRLAGSRMFWIAVLGSVPACIAGFLLKDLFETLFNSLTAVIICLCLTGFILFVTKDRDRGAADGPQDSLPDTVGLSPGKGLLIGTAQAMAIAPGISRSGFTIAAALMLGVQRRTAVFFSFLLAIPAIAGAALLQLLEVDWAGVNTVVLMTGFVSSYLFGLIGLICLVKIVQLCRLNYFSYYLWIVGCGLILWNVLSSLLMKG